MIKLLMKIWENKVYIIQGLYNRVFSSKEIKRMAEERRSICNECPYSSKNTNVRPYGTLPYEHCTACGCMLDLKTYSKDSECPKGKW